VTSAFDGTQLHLAAISETYWFLLNFFFLGFLFVDFFNLGIFLAFWCLRLSGLLAWAFSEPFWKLGCWEKCLLVLNFLSILNTKVVNKIPTDVFWHKCFRF
jgi:hypothetical protein